MQKNQLKNHQKKMVKAIRNLNLQTLESMSSFYLPDAMLSSAQKYRSEINKRLTRIFQFSLKRSQLTDENLFEIAEDFHFDHPQKVLQAKILRIAKKIKALNPLDAVLDDLINIEYILAMIYYSDNKNQHSFYGIPLTLKTNIWKTFPNVEEVVINQDKKVFQVRFDFDPYIYQFRFYQDPFAKSRLSESGDPHNFGKKTMAIGHNFFHKPREIFWEFYLFSKKSPLNKILPTKLAKILLPLEISLKDKTSKKIKNISIKTASIQTWRNAGLLCGWTALFGVTDLHRGNVIISRSGPIAIDIETAFLPYEDLETTGLICQENDTLKWSTGLAELVEISRHHFKANEFKAFLDGFESILTWALKNHQKLLNQIQADEPTINQCANRFIMRNSRYYENPQNKFIAEERVQLNRRDVPFFFTFRNQAGVSYQTESNGKTAKIKAIPSASKELLRLHLSPLKETISKNRIKKLLKESPDKLRGYFGKYD